MTAKTVELRASEVIKQFKPVHTTQDAVDQAASEFYTADLLRRNADARYEAAKKSILDSQSMMVDLVRKRATADMQKYSDYTEGADWRIEISANTPSKRVNVDELRTELIKRGVKVGLIDESISKVEKLSAPATIVKAMMVSRKQEVA